MRHANAAAGVVACEF